MKHLRLILILCIVLLNGCLTIVKKPEVQTTKQWENHYMTVEQFKAGTANIELEKNESIWVLSNSTLSRLLKNYINK